MAKRAIETHTRAGERLTAKVDKTPTDLVLRAEIDQPLWCNPGSRGIGPHPRDFGDESVWVVSHDAPPFALGEVVCFTVGQTMEIAEARAKLIVTTLGNSGKLKRLLEAVDEYLAIEAHLHTGGTDESGLGIYDALGELRQARVAFGKEEDNG